MKIVRCNRCRQDIPSEVEHGVLRHGHCKYPVYASSSMPHNSKHRDLCPLCDVDFIKFLGNDDVPARIGFEV